MKKSLVDQLFKQLEKIRTYLESNDVKNADVSLKRLRYAMNNGGSSTYLQHYLEMLSVNLPYIAGNNSNAEILSILDKTLDVFKSRRKLGLYEIICNLHLLGSYLGQSQLLEANKEPIKLNEHDRALTNDLLKAFRLICEENNIKEADILLFRNWRGESQLKLTKDIRYILNWSQRQFVPFFQDLSSNFAKEKDPACQLGKAFSSIVSNINANNRVGALDIIISYEAKFIWNPNGIMTF